MLAYPSMGQAVTAAAPARAKSPRVSAGAPLAIGAIAVVWFMALSQWLGVTPGHPIVQRQNVLFDSDMSLWIDRMLLPYTSPEQTIHPLELRLWRAPCRALVRVASIFMPAKDAGIFGPRLLVALFAGAGVAALAAVAVSMGIDTSTLALCFAVYLLFTSSVTIALPEHFGITNGLMSMAFAAMILVANRNARRGALALLTIVCGGTSALNGVLPVYCLFESEVKPEKRRLKLLLAAIPVGLVGCAVLYKISGAIHRFFGLYATWRIFRHPLSALVYAIYMFILPAIGPHPYLMGGDTWRMVSYEPWRNPLDLGYYLSPQGFGAAAWVALLGACIWFGLRDEETKQWVRVALGWMLFNIVFYNVWGRELFLWAPAWSWALMALVVLGVRHLPKTFVAAACVVIAACQLYTYETIKTLLVTIDK